MISINPKDVSTGEFHGWMLHAVAPRPIAFASTINEEGLPNLAPYSFFNAYSSNPPTLVFSSNVRVRDNSTKDTLANIKANREVVINVVSYNIMRQMAIASVEYPSNVNEFEKAGFTSLKSELVKPYRVAESPVQMECRVNDIVALGDKGGAGNLFICEILLMHVHRGVLDDNGKIDPQKIDLVARMGANNYCRASGDAIFQHNQPVNELVIGFDQLPNHIRYSNVLTGNDLAKLANVKALPKVDPDFNLQKLFAAGCESAAEAHQLAKKLLENNQVEMAWQVLLTSH
ncbi:flavin reductase family protein [soil metagenome]